MSIGFIYNIIIIDMQTILHTLLQTLGLQSTPFHASTLAQYTSYRKSFSSCYSTRAKTAGSGHNPPTRSPGRNRGREYHDLLCFCLLEMVGQGGLEESWVLNIGLADKRVFVYWCLGRGVACGYRAKYVNW